MDADERAEAVGNPAGIGRRIVAAIVDEDVFRRVGPRRILQPGRRVDVRTLLPSLSYTYRILAAGATRRSVGYDRCWILFLAEVFAWPSFAIPS